MNDNLRSELSTMQLPKRPLSIATLLCFGALVGATCTWCAFSATTVATVPRPDAVEGEMKPLEHYLIEGDVRSAFRAVVLYLAEAIEDKAAGQKKVLTLSEKVELCQILRGDIIRWEGGKGGPLDYLGNRHIDFKVFCGEVSLKYRSSVILLSSSGCGFRIYTRGNSRRFLEGLLSK